MKNYLALTLLIISLSCCNRHQKPVTETQELKPLILVSKDYNDVFQKWLSASVKHEQFTCFNMYDLKNKDSITLLLNQADGIIISGGEDVNPALYGKEDEINRCGSIDTYRDSLEQMMILYAMNQKIPLLGVCRGHQIMNVTFGGTLIIDIPKDVGSLYVHRDTRKEGEQKSTATLHTVYAENGTFLYNIVKSDSGIVYSNHHQAVENLAPEFIASSDAEDMIIESIEPVDTLLHPFILGVQWHPEAMDVNNPFSGNIGRKFIYSVNLRCSHRN